VATARAVAGALGVPHLVFDVNEAFRTAVIDDFVAEYAAGRTPNPCVRCNATVKIPDLFARARTLGCDAIATGHYARILPTSDGPGLFRAADHAKDQAYFLWELPRPILSNLLLPLGELTKGQVREIARAHGLVSAERPESQEICFVPDGDYARFVRSFLSPDHPALRPGRLVDPSGQELGRHEGYLHFTIGQRKGLGGGHGRRLFVTRIGLDGTIEVGEESALLSGELYLERVNLLAPPPAIGDRVDVMIRHRARAVPAHLVALADGRAVLRLEEPARAVTPGQSAVFFAPGDPARLLGGGRLAPGRECRPGPLALRP